MSTTTLSLETMSFSFQFCFVFFHCLIMRRCEHRRSALSQHTHSLRCTIPSTALHCFVPCVDREIGIEVGGGGGGGEYCTTSFDRPKLDRDTAEGGREGGSKRARKLSRIIAWRQASNKSPAGKLPSKLFPSVDCELDTSKQAGKQASNSVCACVCS